MSLHAALWRGGALATPALPALPTGFATLDDVLPGGGWPSGTLTEILAAHRGIGELSLLAPALARLSRQQARWIAWIAPPHLPYAPALQSIGVDLARIAVVQPHCAAEALWATRQALACGACSAVLSWLSVPDLQSLRRLQLAVEGKDTVAFLFRPAFAAHDFSPAALRLQLTPAGERLAVQVLKRRGPHLARPLLLDLSRPQPAEPQANRHAASPTPGRPPWHEPAKKPLVSPPQAARERAPVQIPATARRS